jgi:O-antigen/teichoic acid export membrane protein
VLGYEHWHPEFAYGLAILLLIYATLGNVVGGLFEAVFRAGGNYPRGVMLLNVGRIIDWSGLAVAVVAGGGLRAAAAGTLLGRLLFTAVALGYSWRRFPLFAWTIKRATYAEVAKLVRPSLAFMGFPLGNALAIQGFTLLVGGIFGVQRLALFNTYRTLSRVALQAGTGLSLALGPEFSRLLAHNDVARLRRAYRHGQVSSTAIGIVLAAALFAAAPWILRVWTHGAIQLDRGLFGLFVAATMFGCAWSVPRILMLSSGRHETLGVAYVLVSAGAVAIGWLVARQSGSLEAATGVLVALDAAMLIVSATCASAILRDGAPAEERPSEVVRASYEGASLREEPRSLGREVDRIGVADALGGIDDSTDVEAGRR